jgi:TonB family protein
MHEDDEYWFPDRQGSQTSVFLFFVVSGVCHVLMIAAMIFLPNAFSAKRISEPSFGPVVSVDLIPGPPPKAEKLSPVKAVKPAPEPKKPEPVVKEKEPEKPQLPPETEKPKETVKPEPIKEQPEDADISIAPKKPEPEKPKETPKPKEIVKPIEKPKKTESIDKKAQKNLQNALDRIKKKVGRLKELESTVRDSEPSPEDDEPTGGSPVGIAGGTGGGGGRGDYVSDAYIMQVTSLIEKNWAFAESLAGLQKNLQSVVAVKISSNGEIREVWFKQRSGNKYLDDSADKAVRKSNPLPPLPRGLSDDTIVLYFTPKGVNTR